jgi:hypothetical protein
MKLKLITAALVLATSGSAHAIIVDGETDNGELFMTVLNAVGQQSYILDLNLRMNAVLAGVASGQTWSYAADANMVQFLAAAAGNPLVWAIGAVDSVGATATNYHRMITTASVIDVTDTLRNNRLQQLGTNANQMLGNANGMLGNANSLIVTDPAIPAYAGYALWGDNWGGDANFTATGPIGSSMGLYLLRQSSGQFAVRNQPSIYEALSYNNLPYVAMLDTNGNLSISPVPEPETYALMLAGLGLVGWMARRRKAV